MKYIVAVEFLYHTEVTVDADTPNEALNMVESFSNESIVGKKEMSVNDLEDGEVTGVYNEDGDCLISL